MQIKRLKRKLLPIWVLPLTGSFKLNFDGCALGNLSQLGTGGVIKDHILWFKAFSK